MSTLKYCLDAHPELDSKILYWPEFSTKNYSALLFNTLLNETKWQQEKINFWGKETLVPRLTAWYSKENKRYSYSGVVNNPTPYTKKLSDLQQRVEDYTNQKFNSVLLNLYRSGNDAMGWHADDETSLDRNASIASLSFGGTRDFQIKPKDKSSKLINIKLTNGSLLLMKSPFQEDWLHRIPRRKNSHETRINLTFRKLL